jgi:membrane-associated protease RseP (regulator of RpoE activity)
MKSHPLRILILCSTVALLAACGGGGGGGKLGNSGGGGGDWQQGIFLDADTFFNQCQNPVGTNPFTNQAYGAGSTLDENNFLRSFSDNTYLWYDEIPDQNPALFNNPLAYFNELRTSGSSPSGAPKDKFHFTYTTDEWFDLSRGGVSAGYGIDWAFVRADPPPREIRIAYTEPNSPAATAGLVRGDRVLAINGFDINSTTQAGVDVLNAALNPNLGETYTFTFSSGTVDLTAEEVTLAMVQNVDVIDVPGGGRVGYLTFNYHRAPAEEELFDAIEFLDGQGINDLVLDIRYNGGGFLDIAAQLAYMIAGPVPTAGQTFEEIQFNDKHPITDPITGNPNVPTPFHDETLGFSLAPGQALPTLGLPRVFVLTSGGTCSASEAVMNGLRGVDVEVIQIGTTTCGKPYGFYPQGNCGTHYFTIQFRGVNQKNFGDYTDGFFPGDAGSMDQAEVPGCVVADDFTKQLGDPTEGQLAMALAYRETGACTAPATAQTQSEFGKADTPLATTDGVVYRSPWDSNRIMRR